MTHTYDTLTDELVKQYIYIFSFERLCDAVYNLEDHCLELEAILFQNENKYKEGEYYHEYDQPKEIDINAINIELYKCLRWKAMMTKEINNRLRPIPHFKQPYTKDANDHSIQPIKQYDNLPFYMR